MSITVDGSNVSIIHVRYDGRSYYVYAKDFGYFNGTQNEFFNTVENYLDFNIGILNGYKLDITIDTEDAIIRPQTKFE